VGLFAAIPARVRSVRQSAPGAADAGRALAARKPGDIDFVVVRENTEGEYSSIGGRISAGTERETEVQETVMTRIGVDRVLRYAFELARRRDKKRLTSATKSTAFQSPCPIGTGGRSPLGSNFPPCAGTSITPTF